MSENNMNNEKRSLSVDDILAEARERRAKKLALESSAVLPQNEIKEETEETIENVASFVVETPVKEEASEEPKEELTEETIEEVYEEVSEEENNEEVDELLEIDEMEDEEALKDLELLDGAEEEEFEETYEESFEEAEEVSEKPTFIRNLYEWVGEIVIAVSIVAVLFSFLFRVVPVYGDSMLPNFKNNDKLIISSFLHKPQQGDVIVAVDVLDNPIIKRVIAVGGQTVDIDNETGAVYVDGKVLDESAYIENGITFSNGADKISFPITVKEGYVFALGDNRPVSQDSRFSSVGEISEENILGEVKARFFPFSEFELYF